MTKLELHTTSHEQTNSSSDTDELAWELQQQKPDPHRIEWLITDMGADIHAALKKANLKATDLLKNPLLRPYLQRYLHS